MLTVLVASCCNEAFKIATSSAAYLNNYFMLIGTDGVYSYTFEHERRADCPVCGGESLDIAISKEWTVERLIEMLVEKQDMYARCLVFGFCYTCSDFYFFVCVCTDKSRNHPSQTASSKSTSRRPHN